MKTRFVVTFVLFFVFCLVSAGPTFAGDGEPRFIQHTPGDRNTFFYVSDPLPHLETAVQSTAFARFKDVINGMARAPMPESEEVLGQLKSAAAYIPTEVAMTTTADEVARISKLFHAGLLMSLCEAAIELDEDQSLALLQQQMATQISELQFNSTDIWLDFRTPIPAAIVYGQAVSFASSWAADGLVEVDFTDGIQLKAAAKNWLVDEEITAEVLTEFGVVDDTNTQGAKALAKAVLGLNISVRLRQYGNAMHLTLGESGSETTTAENSVFDGLVGPDPSIVLSGRYQTAEFRKGLEAIQEVWGEWKDKPIGVTVARWDTDGLLTDLDDVVRTLNLTGDAGTLLVRAQDGLQGTLTEVGVPEFQKLAESGVLQLLPETNGVVSTSTMTSLGIMLSNSMSRVEERMATNSLKYEFSGRQAQLQMANRMEEFYYKNLSEFRRLVKTVAVGKFTAPIASIMDANGKVSELSLSFKGAQGRNDLIVGDLQCPRLAMIGGFQAGSDVQKLVADIWKSFYNGLNQDQFEFNAIVADSNRLGQTAYFFTSEWQSNLPSEVRFSASGIEPHYFFVDEKWFVFSTSIDLSQEILRAAKDASRRAAVPGHLTAYGHIPSNALAELFRSGIDAMARLAADQDGIVLTGLELEAFQQQLVFQQGMRNGAFSVLETFSSVLEIFDDVSWESQVKDKTCTTNFSVTFPEF
ncbi:MAG: hypothetical protein ABJZ55_18415 [Fuerstiella sp.]